MAVIPVLEKGSYVGANPPWTDKYGNLTDTMPALALNFAGSMGLDSRITFTRASPASYYGADGYIRYVTNNIPRFDCDPYTLEPKGFLVEDDVSVNINGSETINDTSIWTANNSQVYVDVDTAPDGSLFVEKLVEDSNTATHSVTQAKTFTAVQHSFSIYVKADTRSWVKLSIYDGTSTFSAYFDASTGTVGTTAASTTTTITQLQNGWYRFSVSATTAAAAGTVGIGLASADNTDSYLGDDVSGVYIWGAQLDAVSSSYPTSYIPSTITFTSRASVATYYDENGTLQSAAIDTVRSTYNPEKLYLSPKTLVESSGTNYVLDSENINGADWTAANTTRVSNTTTAPDGTITADTLKENSDTGLQHGLQLTQSVTSGQYYTFSVFVKRGSGTRNIKIQPGGTTYFGLNLTYITVDLSTGTLLQKGVNVTNYTITSLPDNWYRLSVTAKAIASLASGNIGTAILMVSGTAGVYDGDGSSSLYIWGAQYENSRYASSYIKTSGTSLSRSADVYTLTAGSRVMDSANITGTNFSSWYNQSEGTIVVVADTIPSTVFNNMLSINDGTLNNILGMSKNASNQSRFFGTVGGVSQFTILKGTISDTSKNVFVGKYKLNDSSFINNISPTITSDTSCTIPTVTTCNIGKNLNSAPLNGHISQVLYFPKILSDNQLISLLNQG